MRPKWICHPEDNRETRLVPVFRRQFAAEKPLRNAILRLTAHGIYEAEINGAPITETKFTPGLTSYYHRLQVQEYAVTDLLQEGINELRVTVGDGWWRWNNNYGGTLALWGELMLTFCDGHTETISTDEAFEVGTGPVVRADLQKGELFDARILHGRWRQAVLTAQCAVITALPHK